MEGARWNFFANVMDGALFALGLSFVSQQTILPVIVKSIGGGNIAVGMIPVLWAVLFNLPQVCITPLARRTIGKKRLLLKTAIAQRLPWLLLAVAALLVFGEAPSVISLLAFYVLFGLAALGSSLNLPVWFDLVATLTPVERRGRLFGTRAVLGSVLGILGGLVAAWILRSVDPPLSFSLLLFLAFVTMMLSYLFLVSLKEPPTTVPGPGSNARVSIVGLIRNVRIDRNLRNFLIADGLHISAGMGVAFVTVYGLQKFSMPESAAGEFTAVMMASMILGSVVFGALADRYGHRINLIVATGSTVLSSVAAILAPDPATYSIVFVFSALSIGLVTISRLPMLAELASTSERATVVAMANLITSPFVFWGVAGGVIADLAGYVWVFSLAACFAAAGVFWFAFMVHEPRAAL